MTHADGLLGTWPLYDRWPNCKWRPSWTRLRPLSPTSTVRPTWDRCAGNSVPMIPPCTRPWDILGQVQKSYAQTLKARDSGHFVLRETWRDSVNLIGELASVIVDGEIFQIFAARIWMDLAWAALHPIWSCCMWEFQFNELKRIPGPKYLPSTLFFLLPLCWTYSKAASCDKVSWILVLPANLPRLTLKVATLPWSHRPWSKCALQ